MKLISTGVKGLDEMLRGGFPEGRIVLVTGGPGTGKTILSLQYLMAAIDRGEPGVYLSLEEPMDSIKENSSVLGWDLDRFEKSGLLRTLDLYMVPQGGGFDSGRREDDAYASVERDIINSARAIGARHIVVDPITSIVVQELRAGRKRYVIGQLFETLRSLGCTAVLTAEAQREGDFYMEQFLADGVILLNKDILEYKLVKTLRIEKMRGMDYDEQPRRYTVTDRGFQVFNTEQVLI